MGFNGGEERRGEWNRGDEEDEDGGGGETEVGSYGYIGVLIQQTFGGRYIHTYTCMYSIV